MSVFGRGELISDAMAISQLTVYGGVFDDLVILSGAVFRLSV